jgi:hypothetical protein
MRKDTLKEAIRILDGRHGAVARAWAAGKPVQYSGKGVIEWNEDTGEGLYFYDHYNYRIKPTTITGAFYKDTFINPSKAFWWYESISGPPGCVKVSDDITVEIKDDSEIHRTGSK